MNDFTRLVVYMWLMVPAAVILSRVVHRSLCRVHR